MESYTDSDIDGYRMGLGKVAGELFGTPES
jgi:hypothetical protein